MEEPAKSDSLTFSSQSRRMLWGPISTETRSTHAGAPNPRGSRLPAENVGFGRDADGIVEVPEAFAKGLLEASEDELSCTCRAAW